MPNDIANNMADTINQLDEQIKELEAKHWDECRQIAHYDDELKDLREENKVLIRECDRLIKEKGELLRKVSGGDVLRICQIEEQLEKAEELLKEAINSLYFNYNYASKSEIRLCYCDKCLNDAKCPKNMDKCKFVWWKHNEALKLLGGSENEIC